MRRWLEEYDRLLERLERHDIYVYLRAEENDSDTADAKADDALGQLEDRLSDRVVRTAQQLGSSRIEAMSRAARSLRTGIFSRIRWRAPPIG